MPLYRALNDIEVEAGNVLIPKSHEPFLANPKLPNVLPFTLGNREEHAVRDHQWNGEYPTRGVSCTTEWKIALHYAAKTKVIVRISEDACNRFGILRFRVRDCIPLELIVRPQDEEVILVCDKNGAFPKEIIASVLNISSQIVTDNTLFILHQSVSL